MLQGHGNVAIFLQNHFINWLAPYLGVSDTPLLEMSKLFKYQKQTVEDNLVRKGSRLPKIKGRQMTAEYIRCYQKRSRVLLSARMARPFLADLNTQWMWQERETGQATAENDHILSNTKVPVRMWAQAHCVLQNRWT